MQDNQNQTRWAYIAGIMDADGCFMIFRHNRKTKNKQTERALKFPKRVTQWGITYIPGVKIAMIESEAIQLIEKEMGFGHMHIDGARKNRPNSKPIFHWYMRDKFKTATFLENIIPFLRVKKNRALHLLEFCKHLQTIPNSGYRGLSQEELDYREDMYVKMREFNGNKVGATTKPRESERINDSLNILETI
jgi:hypothetical protein